jgi:hypothetical protein
MQSRQLGFNVRRMTPERRRQILENLGSSLPEEPKEPASEVKQLDLEEVGQLFKTYSSTSSREASVQRSARRRTELESKVRAMQTAQKFKQQHPFAPSPRTVRDPLLFNRLAKPKTGTIIQREMQKRREEESLSFQTPRSINSSIVDRLIEQGEVDSWNREIRRQAQADSEAASLVFSPRVDEASRLLSRVVRLPVHLRVSAR